MSDETSANIPTDNFGQCFNCGLSPAECRCNWTGFCPEHKTSYRYCYDANLRCQPPKRSKVEKPAVSAEPAARQAEAPIPLVPTRSFYEETREQLAALTAEAERVLGGAALPWRAKTHHGEITFSAVPRLFQTTALPNKPTTTQQPVQHHASAREGDVQTAQDSLLRELRREYDGFELVRDEAPPEADDPNSPGAIAQHLAETARLIAEAREHPERGLTEAEQSYFRQHFGPRLLPRSSQVPPAMINLKRWVCWKKVWDEEKSEKAGTPSFRKPPHSALTGEAIGATQKYVGHFVDFDTARAAVKKFKLDGLGFVFLDGDDYVGIDFDDCVITQTIEDHSTSVIHDEVKNWLRWFPSYQEFSPSGTGVHILCRGKIAKGLTATPLPNGGGTAEAYTQGRYFTFTGRRIGVTLEVSDCQIGIDKLIGSLTGGKPTAAESTTKKPHAMTVLTARRMHLENLDNFRAMQRPEDPQNDTLNACAFFAAQAFAAGVFNETEEQLKDQLRVIANSTPYCPGIEDTLRSGWSNGITKPLAILIACTDIGNAERFVLKHGSLVRFVPKYGDKTGWYVWNGHRWKQDDKRLVQKLAHDTVRSIYQEAAAAKNEDDRKRLAAWAVKSENSHSITSLLHEAGPYLAVAPGELDADPELLNLENGTLDLRTGGVRAQNPADLITRLLPVRYEPAASCPLFEKHLALVLPDPEVRDYFQEMIAYHFTGDTSAQCIHILQGGGENGKSTTINVFRNLAGDYGWPIDRKFFVADGFTSTPAHEKAELLGRRLGTCSEFEEGDILRVGLMKELTSGEASVIEACRKYGHPFEFHPQIKFLLDSNYLLKIDSPDHGTWRRIRVIRFDQVISKVTTKDPHFDSKLWKERSGLLNWIIVGLRRWNARGRDLVIPDAIKQASDQYKEESDLLSQFLAECCVRETKDRTKLSDLVSEYKRFIKDKTSKAKTQIGKRAMEERLTSKGFQVTYAAELRANVVSGLALRTTNYEFGA